METFSALLAICEGNSPVTLMFSLICAWINGWVNSGEAVDFIVPLLLLYYMQYHAIRWKWNVVILTKFSTLATAVMKFSSKWRHFRFSVPGRIIMGPDHIHKFKCIYMSMVIWLAKTFLWFENCIKCSNGSLGHNNIWLGVKFDSFLKGNKHGRNVNWHCWNVNWTFQSGSHRIKMHHNNYTQTDDLCFVAVFSGLILVEYTYIINLVASPMSLSLLWWPPAES